MHARYFSNPLTSVVLGVNILLTPFRSQNVPPPMSSFNLELTSARTPAHISFSTTNDTVALLWESGVVQVWYLQTRLGPGPGKIMNPIKLGEGSISIGLARRVGISAVVDGKATLAILGSKENNILTCVEVGDGVFDVKNQVDLDRRGGTIADAGIGIWQDSTGQLLKCMLAPSFPWWRY